MVGAGAVIWVPFAIYVKFTLSFAVSSFQIQPDWHLFPENLPAPSRSRPAFTLIFNANFRRAKKFSRVKIRRIRTKNWVFSGHLTGLPSIRDWGFLLTKPGIIGRFGSESPSPQAFRAGDESA
jgi:hypothetical protein